jgi:hypothetical protein
MRWTKLDLSCICFFFKKITLQCFKSSPSISTSWIDRVDFLYFRPSKIHISSNDITSSLFPPWSRLSSDRCHHTTASCHTSFLLSQDELAVSASSFGNALSCCYNTLIVNDGVNQDHVKRFSAKREFTGTFIQAIIILFWIYNYYNLKVWNRYIRVHAAKK